MLVFFLIKDLNAVGIFVWSVVVVDAHKNVAMMSGGKCYTLS